MNEPGSKPTSGDADGVKSTDWLVVIAAVALVSVTVVVFSPAQKYAFVDLDTPEQVINNRLVHGLTWGNLRAIFAGESPGSYYPVRDVTFATDHQFWRLNPRGYKRTNRLIHLINTILVFWLILRLRDSRDSKLDSFQERWDILAAAAGAGVFALHPVVVEPVVWIPGREELLMTLGAIGCVHFQLAAYRQAESGGRLPRRLGLYLGATVCCLLAVLSNAVGAVIPLLALAVGYLGTNLGCSYARQSVEFRGRLTANPHALASVATVLRQSLASWPLWLIAVGAVVIKRMGDPNHYVTLAQPLSSLWLMRVLSCWWLNLKTVFWPSELYVYYDWPSLVGLRDPKVLLGAAAIVAVATGIWSLRRRKSLRLGLLWFLLALAPTAQILPHHICRADRFLYLPLVGVALACASLAGGIPLLFRRVGPRVRIAAAATTGVALLAYLTLLGSLDGRQILTWRDSPTLWTHCLEINPNNAYAHSCLADNLVGQGQFDEGMTHYAKAIELAPTHADTLGDCAWAIATRAETELRDYELAFMLAQRACDLTDWDEPRILRKLAIVHSSLAADLAARREFTDAVKHYRKSIETDEEFDQPCINLALLLTTCPERSIRNPEEAVLLAQRGCRLSEVPDAHRLAILAVAYASAERFDEAVASVEEALRKARLEGDELVVMELRRQRALYREAKPFDPLDEL